MATELIRKYSEALKSSAPVVMENIPQEADGSGPLEPYRKCKKAGQPFDVLFSYIAPNGDLSLKDKGVTIILEGRVLSMDLPYYDAGNMAQFLGKSFTVKVQTIDEENMTVYVRSGRDHRNSVRNRIRKEIRDELKEKREPVVTGKVVKVTPYGAVIDLMGMGVQGNINVRDWSKGYVRDLRTVCKKGDVLDFKIYSVVKAVKGKPERFVLSRRDFEDDRWKSIPEQYLKEGAVMGVRCVECPKDKTFWWGTSEFVPGIEIMGDYTNKFNSKSMMVGIVYKCKVIRSEPEKHRFQVVPFDVTDSDVGTVNAVKFFKDKKEKVK